MLVRGADNTRLKDCGDCGQIFIRPDFDSDLFAEELGRVLADRRISSSVLVPKPTGMSSAFVLENQAAFSAYQLKHNRLVGDLRDITAVIKRTYDRARQTAHRELLTHAPEHTADLSPRLRPARPSMRKPGAEVIDLQQYRHTMPRM